MYFEINVASRKTGHVFATAPRSITTEPELAKVYPLIRAAFPEPEYIIDVTIQVTYGNSFDINSFMERER